MIYRIPFLGVWLTASVAFVVWNAHRLEEVLGAPASQDFRQFWAAGNVLALGGDPYDLKLLSDFETARGAAAFALPLYYPFFTFSALLPLSLISFETARLSYLAIFLFMYAAWFVRPLTTILTWIRGGGDVVRDLLRISVLITFLPFLICLWDGALTIFPFVGLCLFFILGEHESEKSGWRRFARGLSLGFLMVKPNVCFLVSSFLVVHWLRRGGWRELGGVATGALLLVVPVLVLFPSDGSLLSPDRAGHHSLDWVNPTLGAFVQHSLALPVEARTVFAAVAILFSIWRGLTFDGQVSAGSEVRRVMIPLSLVAVPYAWTYDFVVLLFSIEAIMYGASGDRRDDRQDGIDPRIACILICNLTLASLPMAMEAHWWYPLAVLLLCFAPDRRDSPDPGSV